VPSEEDLVRRAQRGDPEAFAKLYEAHFDKIYRYIALKVGNRADAEDLTQQAFLKATEAIGSYRWKGLPFASWLFRIAHNQVIDHFRRLSKESGVPLDEAITVSSDDPASLAEQRLTVAQLVAACDQLTEAQREVIYLRFGSELSIAETAKVMNKREGAIKGLQHDAVVKLRRMIYRDETER
jgi:RNA polymerase sigma-70 factor (ECF subfamily)